MLFWVLVLVLPLVLYLHHVYTRFSRHGVKNLTPIPFFGDMAKLTFQMAQYFENIDKIYTSFPGEKFVGSYEFMRPVVIIRDIELVKQIAVKDFEHFLDHSSIVDDTSDPLFGRTLFALKGQKWKDMRVTLSPVFTSSKMRFMIPFMMEAGDNMINKIKKNLNSEGYYDVDFKDIASRYTNDAMASCFLGIKENSQNVADSQFYKLGATALQFKFIQTLKFFGLQSFPALMKMLKVTMFPEETLYFFKELVTRIMREREEKKINRPDMIHLLMEFKNGNLTHDEDKTSNSDAGLATVEELSIGKKSNSRDLSDEDIILQVIIFSIGGLETSSQVMSFLVQELAFNMDVQEKLAQEIRENDRKTGGKVDITSIHEMTYLDMVVSEVLRLWTPGGAVDRMCTKDYNLGKPNDSAIEDYIIRKGEGVTIPVYSFHRDPKFFPNPAKFDPERFSYENRYKIQPLTFNPFGIGARNCIASRFALYDVKVMIYQLLRHVKISPSEKSSWPIKLSPGTLNVVLKGGHWIRLTNRA